MQPAPDAPPADARGWYLRGVWLDQHGDPAGALSAFAWAARLDPKDPDLAIHVADHRMRAGDLAGARKDCERAVANAPDDGAAHACAGYVAIASGDDALAASELATAAALGETRVFPDVVRARLRLGDLPGAAAAWDDWSRVELEPADRADRGRLGVEVGRDAAAVDDLVVALWQPSAEPGDADRLVLAAARSCRIGTAWGYAVDIGLALRDPQWKVEALRIGLLAHDPMLVESASRDLPEAQAIIDDFGVTSECTAAGAVERANGLDPVSAVELLERAVDADPMDMEAVRALAAAYDAAGMPPRPRFTTTALPPTSP